MWIIFICALALFGIPRAESQIRLPLRADSRLSSIEGVVQTASGLPLSQFTVVAQDERSGTTFGAVTGTDGRFEIKGVASGMYKLSASRIGFSEVRIPGLVVEDNAARSVIVEVPALDPQPFSTLATEPASNLAPSEIRRPERVTETSPPLIQEPVSPPDFAPVTNRWRIPLPQWERYPFDRNSDAPYIPGSAWNPYTQNRLKGDYPIFGNRWFLGLTGTSQTTVEARRDRAEQFSENLILSADFSHGLTTFRPVDLRVRITPVLNGNHRDNRWNSAGAALQEAFVEARLATTSAAFDFVSVRAGIQPFISDFRGFLFATNEPGVRLFGNLRANRHQYNLAYFGLLQKDPSTLLNTLRSRRQSVFIANYYIQDFLTPGYTTEFSIHRTGYGEVAATYFGWSGDGHWGRLNVDHAFYQVIGHTMASARRQSINARMAALEVSADRDWLRYRASFLYASGDSNPNDGFARGFDGVFDTVNFGGSNASFWNRQDVRLVGTDLGLTERFSLYPALRHGRAVGGPNFINPGLYLSNAGVDFDLTTKVRVSANLNFLSFANTAVLENLLSRTRIGRRIGTDAGAIVRWRPFLNNNVVVTAGLSGLIPDAGFRTLANPGPGYSTFMELRLTY